MSVIGKILGYFKTPKYETSGYSPLYSAVVARLKRTGVNVGSTASYPRVEVYGFTEGNRIDKEGELRNVTFSTDCISTTSMADAIGMNDTNLQLLTESGLSTADGWQCIGIIPNTLTDATETSDTNKIIYRIIQSYDVWMERIK